MSNKDKIKLLKIAVKLTPAKAKSLDGTLNTPSLEDVYDTYAKIYKKLYTITI